jgi:hypothetical protein
LASLKLDLTRDIVTKLITPTLLAPELVKSTFFQLQFLRFFKSLVNLMTNRPIPSIANEIV